jgi:hypothetical protein
VVRDRKSEHLWHLSWRNHAAREVPRQNELILSSVVLKLSLTLAPSLARVCKAADQGQATAQAYLGAITSFKVEANPRPMSRQSHTKHSDVLCCATSVTFDLIKGGTG